MVNLENSYLHRANCFSLVSFNLSLGKVWIEEVSEWRRGARSDIKYVAVKRNEVGYARRGKQSEAEAAQKKEEL